MFKLTTTPTYFTEVSVTLPGETKARTFDAEFERLDTDELEAFRKHIVDERLNDKAIAKERIVGWRKVQDEDGSDIPFNAENLEGMLRIHPVPAAITMAFFNSIRGAREKN